MISSLDPASLKPDFLQKQNIDLVCLAGELSVKNAGELHKSSEILDWLPVIQMHSASKTPRYSMRTLTSHLSWTTPEEDLQKLALGLIRQSRIVKEHSNMANIFKLPEGPSAHFFESLDIHKVLGQMLDHFGSKILCKNVHWIHWDEVSHLAVTEDVELQL